MTCVPAASAMPTVPSLDPPPTTMTSSATPVGMAASTYLMLSFSVSAGMMTQVCIVVNYTPFQ
jgi:hypothetical protein